MNNPNMNPKNLHYKFVRLGVAKRKLTYELLAIIPEIFESGIWKKYASTIFIYAGKFGGLSRPMVEKRLNLEKDLQNKPALKKAIKTEGVYKVAMVAKLTTPELDKAMADKVMNMSKSAINTLSKELRQKEEITQATICEAKAETIKIELDEEMTLLFLKLKKKYGKDISHRDTMRIILRKMDKLENGLRIGKKRNFSRDLPGKIQTKVEKDGEVTNTVKPVSRHIPAPKKRAALASTNGRCAYPNCNHPPENWHHRDRFSQSKSHDSVVPLCKHHHEFMHNGLVKNELDDPKNWQLTIESAVNNQIDNLYRKYHRQ
ncbi:HNH endonuclease [Candidatus Peregrinibacteria bacterium]|nr:HNH endonuclease [Candidatus Peregrinibacteria bacterium]